MRILAFVLVSIAVTTPASAHNMLRALEVPQNPAPASVAPQAPTPRPAPPAVPAAPQPAPASAPAPARAPVRTGVPRNLRFDITISETGGSKPMTKSMSLTVNDNGGQASIRNIGRIGGPPGMPVITQPSDPDKLTPTAAPFGGSVTTLNLDVRGVQSYDDGSVRAVVNVEYQPYMTDVKVQPSAITASATLTLQPGSKTQILQTSDPLSDRRTTVEVVATVVK